MVSPTSELRSLEYKYSNGYSSTALQTKKPFVGGQEPDQQQQPLQIKPEEEEFLARLEEERLKIEAFKRELPLCMQLLNNAMEAYRQQLGTYHTNQGNRPVVLEEFIPLNHAVEVSEKTPAAANAVTGEKASWMTTAQLWSTTTPADGAEQHADRGLDNGNPKLGLDAKQRSGGAFLPFTRERGRRARSSLPELEHCPAPEKRKEERKDSEVEMAGRPAESCGVKGGGVASGVEQGKGGTAGTAADGGQAAATQTQRKARRCWSPDLHRRFVNALQMLGGSQVATAKQIRELMNVDGLTNDEVKSHLQKYRLHTRRPIPGTQSSSAAAPQLVVLGGIWLPAEYATTAAAAAAPGIYGGHPPPSHYCTAPVHDFYPAPLQGVRHRHLPPPPQRGLSAAAVAAPPGAVGKVDHELREAEVRGSRDSSASIAEEEEEEVAAEEEEEEEERGRSESSSWKEGEEKAPVPMREEGEVGNGGGKVDLKF